MAKRKGKEEQELWEWCGQVQLFLVVPSPQRLADQKKKGKGKASTRGKTRAKARVQKTTRTTSLNQGQGERGKGKGKKSSRTARWRKEKPDIYNKKTKKRVRYAIAALQEDENRWRLTS